MYQREFSAAICLGIVLVLGCERGSASKTKVQLPAKDNLETVRLHFEGFTKSKSGAT